MVIIRNKKWRFLVYMAILMLMVVSVSAEVYEWDSDKQDVGGFLSFLAADTNVAGSISGTCPNCQVKCGGVSRDVGTYGWGSYGNCEGFMVVKGCDASICKGTSYNPPTTCIPNCVGKCGSPSNGCGGKCSYLGCSSGQTCTNNVCSNSAGTPDPTGCLVGSLKCVGLSRYKCSSTHVWERYPCSSGYGCWEYQPGSIACKQDVPTGTTSSCTTLYSQKCIYNTVYRCMKNTAGTLEWGKMYDCSSTQQCMNPPNDQTAATCPPKESVAGCTTTKRQCLSGLSVWGCSVGEPWHLLEDCQYGCDVNTQLCKTSAPNYCTSVQKCNDYGTKDKCVLDACGFNCVWFVEQNVCVVKGTSPDITCGPYDANCKTADNDKATCEALGGIQVVGKCKLLDLECKLGLKDPATICEYPTNYTIWIIGGIGVLAAYWFLFRRKR